MNNLRILLSGERRTKTLPKAERVQPRKIEIK